MINLKGESPAITSIRKKNSQELFVLSNYNTENKIKEKGKVQKVNKEKNLARKYTGTNLPELFRSMPPRVRFTSPPL